MRKRRAPSDGRFFEPGQTGTPSCAWPDCPEDGLYRAPISRRNLYEYHWFCLEHVRVYNAAWNYYAGLSPSQIEAEIRNDLVGGRPTWTMGTSTHTHAHAHFRAGRDGPRDPFGFFVDDEEETDDELPRPRRGSPEERAMVDLDLKPPLTLGVLKTRYKELVKRYHPDANNGDKDAEERFKTISAAYHTLVNSLSS